MAQWKDAAIEDTVFFWFAANDTGGTAGDGATPLADVRLAGATISDAPILSPTPALISHANFPAGLHEIAVAATDANGFAPDNEYAVFSTLAIDSQNPAGFVGSFFLTSAGKTLHDGASAATNIAIGSAGVNVPAESYVLTTGTQSSGTFADTSALDGTDHEHTDDTGAMDLYYQFDIGGGATAELTKVTGRVSGNNDDLDVFAWNWTGTPGWDQIGNIGGKASTSDDVHPFDLFVVHTGTGVNTGKIRIRFQKASGLTTATLSIDQIFITYAITSRSIGYDDGAIWIDTGASNTNTESFVDGVADNPVSTWAAALTLSGQLNITRFHIINGSSITLSGVSDNYTLMGDAWTLALGGRSISGAAFTGADVSGTGTGATEPQFTLCHFGTTTLPPAHLEGCSLEDTLTAGSAGDFFFENCRSGVAGTSTPVFDFGGALNSSDVNFRAYSGGIEIENMGAGTGSYNMSLEGWGQLIINANCSATSTIAIRGHFDVTDNASGAVTLSEASRYDSVSYYGAKVEFVNDEGASTDRYTVTFYVNGEPTTTGITSPTIQVIKSSDGTDLVASTALTQVASLGIYKRAETTNRQVAGATYRALITATIGGASRTWYEPFGRDST